MCLGVATVAIPVLNVGDSMGGPGAIRTCWAYESTLTKAPPSLEVRTIDDDALHDLLEAERDRRRGGRGAVRRGSAPA
jgi:hypothetical protein